MGDRMTEFNFFWSTVSLNDNYYSVWCSVQIYTTRLSGNQKTKLDCHNKTRMKTHACVWGEGCMYMFLFIMLCWWVFISPVLWVYASSF